MTAAAKAGGVNHDELLRVLSAVKNGDFTARMTVRGSKPARAVAEAINEIIALNEETASEFERVAAAVSREGRVQARARLSRAPGQWNAKVRSVNAIVDAVKLRGRDAAQRLELPPHLCRHAIGHLPAAVADDEDAAAHLRHIRVGIAVPERN